MSGNKTVNYKFRVDDEDNILIEKKFLNSGLSSKSEFFRHMILSGYLITADGKMLDDLTKYFRSISNNINQISLVANRSGNIYKQDLSEIEKELHDIWQLLNFIKSKIQKVERSVM